MAGEALSADGASAALGAGERVAPDPELTAALAGAAGCAPARVASCDLFYDERPAEAAVWRARGAVAVEMEAATLFRLAQLRGVHAGCLLAVSDRLDGDRPEGPTRSCDRIGREDLEAAGLKLGEVAYAALSSADATRA